MVGVSVRVSVLVQQSWGWYAGMTAAAAPSAARSLTPLLSRLHCGSLRRGSPPQLLRPVAWTAGSSSSCGAALQATALAVPASRALAGQVLLLAAAFLSS